LLISYGAAALPNYKPVGIGTLYFFGFLIPSLKIPIDSPKPYLRAPPDGFVVSMPFFRDELADMPFKTGLTEYEGSLHHTPFESPQSPLPGQPPVSHAPHSNPEPPKSTTRPTHGHAWIQMKKRTQFPKPTRYPVPTLHHYEQWPTRSFCLLCRWKKSRDMVEQTKSVNMGCQECGCCLCRDCFHEFHPRHVILCTFNITCLVTVLL
jgi:hypothetical protein